MLYWLMMIAALGGVLTTVYLVYVCWRDPVAGLRNLQHDPGPDGSAGKLPQVMLGRYIGFLIMSVGALLSQSALVLLVISAGLTFMAFHDAQTYKTAGKPFNKHVQAGVLGAIVFAISGLAWLTGAA
ncbi:MAG: hypothetical protein AAGD04_14925 [Pseudomonadota bacterium]